MKNSWSLPYLNASTKSERGSITAETAISIMFILVSIFIAINVLLFAMQYQRLLTLAQEGSRTAASMADPRLLEEQVTSFISNIDSEIKTEFLWESDQIKIILTEPTAGLLNLLHKKLSVEATSPRWTAR